MARARVFLHQGEWGLVDPSGALWPIEFALDPEQEFKSLDWLEVRFAGVSDQSLRVRFSLCRVLTNSSAALARAAPPPVSPEFMIETLPQFEMTGVFWQWLNSAVFSDGYTEMVPFGGVASHQLLQSGSRAARQLFRSWGFSEVEAPVCVMSGGMERYLKMFSSTYIDYHGREYGIQLPTSPEFALKKALARGTDRIFSLAPSFRNGGEISDWHQPQFTMLEWYQVGADLKDLIKQTGGIINAVRDELLGHSCGRLMGGVHGEALGPFSDNPQILSIPQIYADTFHIDLAEAFATGDAQDFYRALKQFVPSVRPDDTLDELFWKSFCDVIEPGLRQQDWVVLTGFPVGYATLAAPDAGGVFAKRFEIFARGVEICNGYEELTDAGLMEERFSSLLSERSGLQRDAAFEDAMRFGIPPCAGNALGMDRLVSAILGAQRLFTGHSLGAFVTAGNNF